MTVVLRPARSTDAGKLGAMLGAAARAHPWKPVLHTGAEDIAHCGGMIDRGWVTVAEADGRVAGFIARNGTEVNALFVAEDLQNQGFGSALLRDAMARAGRLQLWTFLENTGARRFYERFGFAEMQRGDGSGNDEGLPDVQLLWTRPEAGDKT